MHARATAAETEYLLSESFSLHQLYENVNVESIDIELYMYCMFAVTDCYCAALALASQQLLNSNKLRKVLELVLLFGNYMNTGIRGNAYGKWQLAWWDTITQVVNWWPTIVLVCCILTV